MKSNLLKSQKEKLLNKITQIPPRSLNTQKATELLDEILHSGHYNLFPKAERTVMPVDADTTRSVILDFILEKIRNKTYLLKENDKVIEYLVKLTDKLRITVNKRWKKEAEKMDKYDALEARQKNIEFGTKEYNEIQKKMFELLGMDKKRIQAWEDKHKQKAA